MPAASLCNRAKPIPKAVRRVAFERSRSPSTVTMHPLTTTFVNRLRQRDETAWFELW